ncbi:hypothetical protein GY45DRAFT_1328598 [Cubamyces sp. BRFM 1775]|nr:hypothetical protein GY45DRAFT_1328598 [Cubamyces sp. BRFM 1775]
MAPTGGHYGRGRVYMLPDASRPSIILIVRSSLLHFLLTFATHCLVIQLFENMQSVQRPLHPLNVNHSTYSALAGAVHGAVLPPRSGSHQAKLPTGRKVIETEVRSRRSKGSPWPYGGATATISFKRSQPSSLVREGISFKEILDGRSDLLVGANDIALPDCLQQTITLQFDWPGYSHTEYKKTVKLMQKGQPVSLFEVAKQVRAAYETYFFPGASKDQCRLRPDENDGMSWDLSRGIPDPHLLVLTALSNEDGPNRTYRATLKLLTLV